MNSFKIFSLALAAILLVSCNDGGDEPPTPPTPDNGTYIGTFVVAPDTGDAFTLEGAGVVLDFDEQAGTVDIELVAVKFAQMMPQMDITIPGADYLVSATGTIVITGDGIVPTAVGGPVERYTINDLIGSVGETGRELTLAMMCGTYPLTFSGILNAEE